MGRRARLQGLPREGPECAPKSSFWREPEMLFTAGEEIQPPTADGERRFCPHGGSRKAKAMCLLRPARSTTKIAKILSERLSLLIILLERRNAHFACGGRPYDRQGLDRGAAPGNVDHWVRRRSG